MEAIIFYITRPILYGISLLPFWCLYRLSDLLFIIIYYLVGYRKKVVLSNLRNSFPEKTESEILQIQRKFYRYFCDLIVETIKTLTITPASLRKRLSFIDTSVFKKYYADKQSIIIVMGHWGNWELGGARFAIEPFHKLFVIYHPLKNPYFDRMIYKMRSRLGNGLIAMKDTLRSVIRNKTEITATAFIADQTPSPKDAYWMQFLNQDTAVFTGIGKIACKMNYPVIFASVKRVRRGHYEISLEELAAEPETMEPVKIVELFTQRLEKDIRKMPEIWLWTHKRWKHKRTM